MGRDVSPAADAPYGCAGRGYADMTLEAMAYALDLDVFFLEPQMIYDGSKVQLLPPEDGRPSQLVSARYNHDALFPPTYW